LLSCQSIHGKRTCGQGSQSHIRSKPLKIGLGWQLSAVGVLECDLCQPWAPRCSPRRLILRAGSPRQMKESSRAPRDSSRHPCNPSFAEEFRFRHQNSSFSTPEPTTQPTWPRDLSSESSTIRSSKHS
jgi:hypothetical protein